MNRLVAVGVEYAKSGCYLCLRNTDVIDFGISIEGEGGLAVCSFCLQEACRLLGWVPTEEAIEIAQETEALKVKLHEEQQRIRPLERKIAAYEELYGRLPAKEKPLVVPGPEGPRRRAAASV